MNIKSFRNIFLNLYFQEFNYIKYNQPINYFFNQKYEQKQLGTGHLCTSVTFARRHFCTSVTLARWETFARRVTFAREDTFAWRHFCTVVTLARRDICARRLFCTEGHFCMRGNFCTEGHFCTQGNFLRRHFYTSKLLRRYICMAIFLQSVTFARRYIFTDILMN